jgi:pimeloyl-ACP methyl ester carboxylesterase
MPHAYDPSKPTLVLVNSFTTSSELYRQQYANAELNKHMNLLAIELLGHGQTRLSSAKASAHIPHLTPNFTYWDTAIMNLQVISALGIKGKIFVLGTSQGGWITVRMALLAPDVITGIIPLGTSMDYESERTRKLGCWDGVHDVGLPIAAWTATKAVGDDWTPDLDYCDFLIDIGFGKDCASDVRDFWRKTIQGNYSGDDGRKRARMAAVNLRDRDGLHGRLSDVVCPVLWLHGSADVVYSVANAREEIKLFVNSPDVQLKVVEGGAHFLSASHPKEVDNALIEFVGKYGKN